MKIIMVISGISLLTSMFFFISCSKNASGNRNGYAPPEAVRNNLSGSGFVFDSLLWQRGDMSGSGQDDIYVFTAPRPDLFDKKFVSYKSFAVLLKPDTTASWINIPEGDWGDTSNGYYYSFSHSQHSLYIYSVRSAMRLPGTYAAVRVQFQ